MKSINLFVAAVTTALIFSSCSPKTGSAASSTSDTDAERTTATSRSLPQGSGEMKTESIQRVQVTKAQESE